MFKPVIAKTFITSLKDFVARAQVQRHALDVAIAECEAVLACVSHNPRPTTPKTRRKHGPDRDSQAKTLAFISARKRPVTINAVVTHFRISPSAAVQRVAKLVAAGKIERIARGRVVPKVTNRTATKVVRHAPPTERRSAFPTYMRGAN